jgi:hypothetical protein
MKNKFQLYTMTLHDGGIAEIGQLIFESDDSAEVAGLIVDHDEDRSYVTAMLFEAKEGPIPDFIHTVIKETLSFEEIQVYLKKCEDTWPGYLNWIINMDEQDWRIGCPIGRNFS